MPSQQARDSIPEELGGPGGLLEHRRAFVVGGSGGLGRAVACELARRGASLLVHGGSSRERLEATLRELRELGSRSASFDSLLLPIARPRDLVARLPELGKIDILVCSFGPFLRSSLAHTSAEDWERLALLDLALPGALASALLPAMGARHWGRMLFFGGTRTDAIRAYRSNAAYAAAKTGVAVLVKSLAVEGGASGVAALGICPGLMDTEYLDEGLRQELRAKAPGGELLDSVGLARAAVDLLAAEPCVATGSIVNVDGGLGF
ncbi:MAG TPA: SDR family NAD(P)-dependent oxidoreductase [Rectinemataceae bacterium]|nr:SDR family NAD(P)-dependent oxidoreductase [Rectinemataceae bacterium]